MPIASRQGENMKPRISTWMTAISLLAVLALPSRVAAHQQGVHFHRQVAGASYSNAPANPVTALGLVQQVDHLLRSTNFSGSVLLARHGKILLARSYGMADKGTRTRNTPHMKLPVFGISAGFVG